MVFYYTRWGLTFVWVNLFLCIYAGRCEVSAGLKKLAAVTSEFALQSQVGIVIIYWPLLHKDSLA